MVQAVVHLHLAKLGTIFEKGQIVKAVGDRDVAVGRSAQFLGAEKAVVEVDELCRIFGEISDVA